MKNTMIVHPILWIPYLKKSGIPPMDRVHKPLNAQVSILGGEFSPMGYVALAEAGAEMLFQVIAGRAEKAAVVITTNLPLSEWTTVFPNARLCKAMVDRVTDRPAGGTGIYTWPATGLPDGLSIGPTTGAITGTPSTRAFPLWNADSLRRRAVDVGIDHLPYRASLEYPAMIEPEAGIAQFTQRV